MQGRKDYYQTIKKYHQLFLLKKRVIYKYEYLLRRKAVNITLVIDRFEGKHAVLESQEKNPLIFNFPLHLLPQEAK